MKLTRQNLIDLNAATVEADQHLTDIIDNDLGEYTPEEQRAIKSKRRRIANVGRKLDAVLYPAQKAAQ